MRHTHIITGTLIGIAALSVGTGSTLAQTPEAIILVDVVVVNDNDGALDSTTVEFNHPDTSGGTGTGTDGTAGLECLTSDSGSCYIASIPIGVGELIVPPVDGYTTTIECRVDEIGALDTEAPAESTDADNDDADASLTAAEGEQELVAGLALSTASGATWDADDRAEIFCLVTLDDDAPTTPTTTAPPTTAAPTTAPPETTPPVTEVPTTPAPAPAPTGILPSTGPSDNTMLALFALLLVLSGAGIVRFARR